MLKNYIRVEKIIHGGWQQKSAGVHIAVQKEFKKQNYNALLVTDSWAMSREGQLYHFLKIYAPDAPKHINRRAYNNDNNNG